MRARELVVYAALTSIALAAVWLWRRTERWDHFFYHLIGVVTLFGIAGGIVGIVAGWALGLR
jgi:hypothetical protein